MVNSLKTIDDMKKLVYIYHNFVNSKTNRPLFNYGDLDIYNNRSITNTFNVFATLYANNAVMQNINYANMVIVMRDVDFFIKRIIDPYCLYTYNPVVNELPAPSTEEHLTTQPVQEDVQTPSTDEHLTTQPVEENVQTPSTEDHLTTQPVEEDAQTPSTEEIPPVIHLEPPRAQRYLMNKDLILKTDKKFADDRNIYGNISVIDDKYLPSTDLSLFDAILEMKKNPICAPLDAYIERWKRAKNIKCAPKNRRRVREQKPPEINDALLPPLNLSLPLAIKMIQDNPKCVPNELLYLKRWNELKVTQIYYKNSNSMIKKIL